MANQLIQIKREKDRDTTLDYARLRARALTLIQELSGHTWTDYNLHDPGVTILEQLCFAITDLAYKTDFPINEILADKEGRINVQSHAFYNKTDILSSGTVTVNDYRKLVLDRLPDVENIWIEPVISGYIPGAGEGVYRAYIQPLDSLAKSITQNPEEAEQLLQAVRKCLVQHRNLGENFEEILLLKPQPIFIKAAIMVDEQYPVKETLAHVCNAIEHVIHPPVRFISEAELRDAGYTTEDIYSGPQLSGGFIPDSDLRERRHQVDPSELVRDISQVTGVLQVKYLYLSADGQHYDNKPVDIKEGCYPYVDIKNEGNDIGIYSDQFEQHTKDAVFWALYQKLREIRKRHYTGQQRGLTDHSLHAPYRDITQYHSLQYFFPVIYGIGADGISEQASDQRKAQAKQLKAYLLLFEQVLANYLSQLGSLDILFSPEIHAIPPQTYFFQPLYQVPHVKDLLKAYTAGTPWEEFIQDNDNAYMQTLRSTMEQNDLYLQRKIRMLDHLLARFNLVLPKYPVSLYERLYGKPGEQQRSNMELEWKAQILRHVPVLLRERIQSFSYLEEITETSVCRGYQNWMHALLHIKRDHRQPLTAVFEQEHIDMQPTGTWHPVPETRRIHVGGETLWVTDDIIHTGDKYHFGHQPVSVLKSGVDPANYRIIKDGARNLYLVLYKTPAQNTWKTLSHQSSREKAIASQEEIIQHLQQLSMDAEGFYIVEHVLLKPSLKAAAFGFRLIEADGTVLLEQLHTVTYEEREKHMEILLGKQWTEVTAADMYQELSSFCRINTGHHDIEDAMKHIAVHLDELKNTTRTQYPRIEYVTMTGSGYIYPESFFRTSVSIVLPLWPARFQYAEFRKFTEEMFREQTPAHYKLHFKWLGVAEMRTFEESYYPWLKELTSFFETNQASPSAEKLIRLLISNSHRK